MTQILLETYEAGSALIASFILSSLMLAVALVGTGAG